MGHVLKWLRAGRASAREEGEDSMLESSTKKNLFLGVLRRLAKALAAYRQELEHGSSDGDPSEAA
jgi:hypothetical protein